MLKSINEKYYQPICYRNDIYRKFEKQFKYCFLNPITIDSNLYIEHDTNEYTEVFDAFFESRHSDVKFFIGYTGVGKTTFIKHYFDMKTLGVSFFNSDAIVIPNSWDGKKISKGDYETEIKEQISNVIENAIDIIYKPIESIMLYESDDLLGHIKERRPDILSSLTMHELMGLTNLGCSINQLKLQKSKEKYPVEFSCSVLKYVLEKHNENKIKRVIFVVDDLETLSQKKLCYIIESYFKIYACLHNTVETPPIVNLLISLRPHSYRFLRNDINPYQISSYGNYLNGNSYRLIKNCIPNIKEIFIRRFENAINNTPDAGNLYTWKLAKEVFYEIINDFDDGIIDKVSELCHMNIRAITDCFQLILSNRVWCQDFEEYSEYPNVKKSDYRFDIVNVIRTLACGENPIYTGCKELMVNPTNLSNVQARPVFDDSDVFIPNLLVDVNTRECDVLSLIIIEYLEGLFSSSSLTLPQTEFIKKRDLIDTLCSIFGNRIESQKISATIEYLFKNRIIRKSIISKDSDETINKIEDDDYVYLTLKGSRLLKMLESDSVLLEIYREDIKRNYSNEMYYKSSIELISENKRQLLFEDLIRLAEEIYIQEDTYIKHIIGGENSSSFYDENYKITMRIISGISNSISRSQKMKDDDIRELNIRIFALKEQVKKRINEIDKSKCK